MGCWNLLFGDILIVCRHHSICLPLEMSIDYDVDVAMEA